MSEVHDPYRKERFDAWTLDRDAVVESGGGIYLRNGSALHTLPRAGQGFGKVRPVVACSRVACAGRLELASIKTKRFARKGIEWTSQDCGDGRGDLWLFMRPFGFTSLSWHVENGSDRLNYIIDDLIVTNGIIMERIDRFEGLWYPGDPGEPPHWAT